MRVDGCASGRRPTGSPEGFARFFAVAPIIWACRCFAPPGFRAAPRAVFVVTAIRLQSLTPSHLRRCALRLPPGESPAGYPRRAQLGAPRCRRTGCTGSARPAPRPMGGARGYALACCGRLCETVPSSTLAVRFLYVTKDDSPTCRPALRWSFHATPQACGRELRQGRFGLVVGALTWPASGRKPV